MITKKCGSPGVGGGHTSWGWTRGMGRVLPSGPLGVGWTALGGVVHVGVPLGDLGGHGPHPHRVV